MESRARLLGHPIHQMLVALPLGLLVMAALFDGLFLATGNRVLATVAFWDIAAGVVAGLLAAVFGLVDWLAIPEGSRARRVGMAHGLGNVMVVALFAISWWLRRGDPAYIPSTAALACSFLGLTLGAVTGWLGGELVDRLGVGVDTGAHLDAPSSLTGPVPDTMDVPPDRTVVGTTRGLSA
jgi:uncharacterized membrane protein